MCDNRKKINKNWKRLIFFLTISIIYFVLGKFCLWFNQNLYKDMRGIPLFISLCLVGYWYFDWRKSIDKISPKYTGFGEENQDKYTKNINRFVGSVVCINLLWWMYFFFCKQTDFDTYFDFLSFGLFVSMGIILIMIVIILPFQPAILDYSYKRIDKDFYLNVWNKYVLQDKNPTNFTVFNANTTSITNNEVGLVRAALTKEKISDLKTILLYKNVTKYRGSGELTLTTIVSKLIKVFSSVSIITILCNYIKKYSTVRSRFKNKLLQL